MRREILIILTNQSCLQYKPWKCPRPPTYCLVRQISWQNSVNRNASNEMSEHLQDKIRSMLCNKPDEITRFSQSGARRKSRNAGRFKSTNQRLAYRGSPPWFSRRSNPPEETKRWLVDLKRPAFLEFLWSLSFASIILRKLYLWL